MDQPCPTLSLSLQVLTPLFLPTLQADPLTPSLSVYLCQMFPFFLLYWKDLHILPSLEEDFTQSHR